MPDEPRAPEPRKKGVKGALTHKIGPLPTWVWLVIVAAIILAWVVYKNKKAAKQASSSVKPGAGQVPQFVNQTFTQVQPPPAPDQDHDESNEDKDRARDHDGVPHPKRPRPRPLPGGEGGPGEGKTEGPPPVRLPPKFRKRRHVPVPV